MAKKRIIYEFYESFIEHYPWRKEMVDSYFDIIRKKWYKWEIRYMKEKYWSLRIEWWWDEWFSTTIRDIEENSMYVCCVCWKRWKIRNDIWRIQILCKKHYQEKLDRIKKESKKNK